MGLSSNVMNMKFMQKASDKAKPDDQQPAGRKVKDSSEWSLPNGFLKQKIKPAITIKTVGYGSIASLTAQDDEDDEKKQPETPQPEKSEPSKNDEAQKFLSGILDKAHKDKKRSQKQGKQPRKKTKISLS